MRLLFARPVHIVYTCKYCYIRPFFIQHICHDNGLLTVVYVFTYLTFF